MKQRRSGRLATAQEALTALVVLVVVVPPGHPGECGLVPVGVLVLVVVPPGHAWCWSGWVGGRVAAWCGGWVGGWMVFSLTCECRLVLVRVRIVVVVPAGHPGEGGLGRVRLRHRRQVFLLLATVAGVHDACPPASSHPSKHARVVGHVKGLDRGGGGGVVDGLVVVWLFGGGGGGVGVVVVGREERRQRNCRQKSRSSSTHSTPFLSSPRVHAPTHCPYPTSPPKSLFCVGGGELPRRPPPPPPSPPFNHPRRTQAGIKSTLLLLCLPGHGRCAARGCRRRPQRPAQGR